MVYPKGFMVLILVFSVPLCLRVKLVLNFCFHNLSSYNFKMFILIILFIHVKFPLLLPAQFDDPRACAVLEPDGRPR